MSKNSDVNYQLKDISNIASFLCGKTITTAVSDYSLPKELIFTEEVLYGLCYDWGLDDSVLWEENEVDCTTTKLICSFIEQHDFSEFLSHILGVYVEGKTMLLAERGYDIFLVKSEILKKINSLWSIKNQEFAYESDGHWTAVTVRFKEYDKLGVGGFSTVYNNSDSKVYKVLNQSEKSSESSVHRFKREFEIMQEHNGSGYTINVSDYESANLVYQMERASASLEEYIENNPISEMVKDEIVIRCVECMSYLHSKNVVHRDFHPGNILLNADGDWVVTDFGLAKSMSEKYSRVTNSTRAVGRFWYTDPIQLGALKDGSYTTDIYSLAKTIDYVFNGDQSQRPNKYTAIINKATAPDIDARYSDIYEFEKDIRTVIDRQEYQSPKEIVSDLLKSFNKSGVFDTVTFANTISNNSESGLVWDLVVSFGNSLIKPYVSLSKSNYDLCYNTITKLYDNLLGYHQWDEYDIIAYWAADVLRERPNMDDGISSVAADIVDYVASNIGRFDIKRVANTLKYDTDINTHIRAKLEYHEGY